MIRAATAIDLPRMHALNEANVPEVGTVPGSDWAPLAELADIRLVAETDSPGEVVGFCFVMGPGTAYGSVNYTWFMERYDDAYYLDRVAVDSQWRGRRIASQLYAEVEDRILTTRSDIRWLTLEVNVDPPNPVSVAFHERHGFVEVGRQSTPYGTEVALLAKALR